jgi:penicillin amidase
LKEDGLEALKSYAAGVNAYLGKGSLPYEFKIAGFIPEPWKPADSMAILRYLLLSEQIITLSD